MTTDYETVKASVAEAGSLDELQTLLNGYRQAYRDAEAEDFLSDMLRLDEVVDLSSLPIFGGEEPETGTLGVFSWDSDRVMIVNDSDDFEIVTRTDWTNNRPV